MTLVVSKDDKKVLVKVDVKVGLKAVLTVVLMDTKLVDC